MNRTLIILQGAPGSGKSTVAEALTQTWQGVARQPVNCIFSTDDFWRKNGDYEFDGSKLGIAHQWNQESVRAAMQLNYEQIIVDNTNTLYVHAKPYFDMAEEFLYSVQVIRVDPGLATCQARNSQRPENRQAPPETVARMHRQMEDLWERRAHWKAIQPKAA